MAGWGKLVAGALIGAAGTLYATNEELRKQLPRAARDLPVAVRRRFEAARTAGQEASARRRAEILRDLKPPGGDHARRRSLEASQEDVTPAELGKLPPNPEEPAVRAAEDV
jgi:hypothetical protein